MSPTGCYWKTSGWLSVQESTMAPWIAATVSPAAALQWLDRCLKTS
jgi:hypothetical protein